MRRTSSRQPASKRRKLEEKPFARIATVIDKSLQPYNINKQTAVVHIDGEPSQQKSRARMIRSTRHATALNELDKQVTRTLARSRAPSSRLYKRAKDLYRPTRDMLLEIENGLRLLGWNVHT
ncbi:unnamed protein product [Mortierella alpina]